MCFRVKMFRVESYLLYIFYTWSIWTLTSTSAKCTNLTLDCTKSIILTSPNYPLLYPNGAFEEWNITAPHNRRILVTFDDFSLEDALDLIIIRDRYHERKFYTGDNVRFPPYLTSGHTLHIEFTSSRSGKRKGFNISVSCNEIPNTSYCRLMAGASPGEGFLELFTSSGEWKRVCEDSFTERVAEVICGELAYPGFKEISYENSTCASDHLKGNCTRAPSCKDDTYRLVDCTTEHSMCSSEKVVKIKCHEPGYKGCYELETKILQNSSRFTFSSPARCIYSCKTNGIQAIAIMNQMECLCSTSAEVHLEDARECGEETTSLSKVSVYDASVGFCEELNVTAGGSWDSKITWFGSIVHLTCMDGYILQGNGTLQCVPGLTPYHPLWNDTIPDCTMDATTGFTTVEWLDGGSPSTESKSTTNIFEITTGYTATSFYTSTDVPSDPGNTMGISITVPIAILVLIIIIIIGVYIYYKHGGNCQSWKGGFGQRQGQTDDTLSTPTNNRGRAVSSNSARSPNGSTSPPRNDSSVISSALPDNTPEDSQPTEAPRVPSLSRPSNASNRPFGFLHRNNPRSDNHYVSSTSVPNTCYYASSFDNPRSGDTVRLREAYQESSSMDIANHAYEGSTSDEGQSNVTLDVVNLYHYASSSEFPMVVSTGATNSEKAYEESFNIDMAEHAYEGTSDDLEQSRTTIEDRFCRGFSMKSRPLPHRPSSANCKEGPALPPRKSSRSSKNAIHEFAPLRERKCTKDIENNNNLVGACSSDSKLIHDLPKKHATSNKRKGQIETPLYHTLEDDEQTRSRLQHDNQESPTLTRPQDGSQDPFYHCLENENQGPYSGDNHLAYDVPVSTNAQDSTDLTESARMIDNILYVPMLSCSKKH